MSNIIWLTGISGAGKTTLGLALKEKFKNRYGSIEFLDGEAIRRFFGNDLGFSRKERILNVKRIAFAAMLVAENGTNVIVANIAPYYEVRDFIRKNLKNYIQIYLKVSVEEAIRRDVKGHYKAYREGRLKDIIGLDDGYDVPRNPDLVIDTERETVEESLSRILNYLKEKGHIKDV